MVFHLNAMVINGIYKYNSARADCMVVCVCVKLKIIQRKIEKYPWRIVHVYNIR